MTNAATSEPGTVLVTGAARRIGAAIAAHFHARGFNVVIHCNNSLHEAGALASAMNRRRVNSAKVLQADLTRDLEVANLASQATEAFDGLNVVVNNASSFYPTPLGQVTTSQWHELVDSNLRAAFFLCQALADGLKARHASIVNVIDIYAEQPLLHYPVYSIAKAGLQAMTRALAIELAPQVRVNGVAPGAILWPESDQDESAIAAHQAVLQKVPLGRSGTAEDVAETVWFLAVEAGYVTGEVIRVDGGRRLNL